ncbi:MAG: pseudouridine synthase [Planctomycetota bacterium]
MPERNTTTDFTDASRGERLQRVLADAGIGSRRACEALIESGEVAVNGVLVASLPAWVDPDEERIVVEGRPLPKPERKTYLLLNKPPRTLSTLKDEPGADRRTVAELVDHPAVNHLFPVGRLDYDTVGLVLMTNDGALANKLTHPRYGVPKTYRVLVRGALDPEAIAELERGIYLAERKAGATVGARRTSRVELALIHQDREGTVLELTLREGRNRQVRRMMAAVGYPVRKLERVGMGPIRLKGVARGAWRELTRDEIRALRRAAADRTDGSSGRTTGSAPGKAGPKSRDARGVGSRGGGKNRYKAKSDALPADAGRSPGVPGAKEDAKPGIKRRTLKNAINRATHPKAPERARGTPGDSVPPKPGKPDRRSGGSGPKNGTGGSGR